MLTPELLTKFKAINETLTNIEKGIIKKGQEIDAALSKELEDL